MAPTAQTHLVNFFLNCRYLLLDIRLRLFIVILHRQQHPHIQGI